MPAPDASVMVVPHHPGGSGSSQVPGCGALSFSSNCGVPAKPHLRLELITVPLRTGGLGGRDQAGNTALPLAPLQDKLRSLLPAQSHRGPVKTREMRGQIHPGDQHSSSLSCLQRKPWKAQECAAQENRSARSLTTQLWGQSLSPILPLPLITSVVLGKPPTPCLSFPPVKWG